MFQKDVSIFSLSNPYRIRKPFDLAVYIIMFRIVCTRRNLLTRVEQWSAVLIHGCLYSVTRATTLWVGFLFTLGTFVSPFPRSAFLARQRKLSRDKRAIPERNILALLPVYISASVFNTHGLSTAGTYKDITSECSMCFPG